MKHGRELSEPVVIRRFKPIDIRGCDPDSPIFYQQPTAYEYVRTCEDIGRLGERLFEAEQEAWESRNAQNIIETVADGACSVLMDCVAYLKSLGDDAARHHADKISEIYLQMKEPWFACVGKALASIYVKEGMEAVKETVDKFNSNKESEMNNA